jgi:hypothetical protein
VRKYVASTCDTAPHQYRHVVRMFIDGIRAGVPDPDPVP